MEGAGQLGAGAGLPGARVLRQRQLPEQQDPGRLARPRLLRAQPQRGGELPAHQGGEEEDQQGDPLVGVADGEGEDRLDEAELVGEEAGERGEDGGPAPPAAVIYVQPPVQSRDDLGCLVLTIPALVLLFLLAWGGLAIMIPGIRTRS